MLVKRADDIRVLRSPDPRIARQMLDLSPYRPVSDQPATTRDLSLAVSQDLSPEELGARVREELGEGAVHLEAVEVLAETGYRELPAGARERLGMRSGQKNVLVRLVIRHLTRTLESREANELRNRVYRALHEGRLQSWAQS
jgi:phenylalanyl-tRNA synthetase alpha chain